MLQAAEELFLLGHDLADSRGGLQQRAHVMHQGGVLHIHVRHLMVGDGEDLAATQVDGFAAEFVLDADPAFLAEDAVQVHRAVHVGDAVFGEQDDLDVALLVEADEVADDIVDVLQVLLDGGHVQAAALEVVV